jgi:hypothetical protein
MHVVASGSILVCVGGYGEVETETHIFFNCPILSVVWNEIIKWIRIPIALAEGGQSQFSLFKGLSNGSRKERPWSYLVYNYLPYLEK